LNGIGQLDVVRLRGGRQLRHNSRLQRTPTDNRVINKLYNVLAVKSKPTKPETGDNTTYLQATTEGLSVPHPHPQNCKTYLLT